MSLFFFLLSQCEVVSVRESGERVVNEEDCTKKKDEEW